MADGTARGPHSEFIGAFPTKNEKKFDIVHSIIIIIIIIFPLYLINAVSCQELTFESKNLAELFILIARDH